MKLALDLDGTLIDFVSTFQKVCEEFGVKTDITQYGMGVPREKFLEMYDWMIDVDMFTRMTPCLGAKKTVKRWAKDREIFYVTRRRPANEDFYKKWLHQSQTKEWLYNWGFPTPQNVVFTQEKGIWCAENDVKILVEDFLLDAKKWNSDSLRVWLVDCPWNQGEYPHRVKSLSKIKL